MRAWPNSWSTTPKRAKSTWVRNSTYEAAPMQTDAITVDRFYTEHAGALELNLIAGASGLNRVIREPTVNRPGLVLAGFTRYFANKRLQVIGNAESWFLRTLPPAERAKRFAHLFSYRIPAVIFSRNLQPDRGFLRAAE